MPLIPSKYPIYRNAALFLFFLSSLDGIELSCSNRHTNTLTHTQTHMSLVVLPPPNGAATCNVVSPPSTLATLEAFHSLALFALKCQLQVASCPLHVASCKLAVPLKPHHHYHLRLIYLICFICMMKMLMMSVVSSSHCIFPPRFNEL